MRHRWTSGDLRRVRELAAIGYTAPDAAATLGLNERYMRICAAAQGIRFKPARRHDVRARATHPAVADLAAVKVQRTIDALAARVRMLQRS